MKICSGNCYAKERKLLGNLPCCNACNEMSHSVLYTSDAKEREWRLNYVALLSVNELFIFHGLLNSLT